MRRYWVVALAVLTFLGMLSPPAFAQAPAPKVTITGLIDTVTSAHWNLSMLDGDFTRSSDTMWSSRQRGVFFITGEVDKAKAVLGLELDLGWGMTSTGHSNTQYAAGPQLPFSTGEAFGLGDDNLNVIEIKNMYVEFPVPLIPWATTLRIGGQPGAGVAQYKPILFFDDFPGVYLVTTITPAVKFHFFYAAVDEDATGCVSGGRFTGGGARRADACAALIVPAGAAPVNAFGTRGFFNRGDDMVVGLSVDVTPIKELQVRPNWVRVEVKGQPTNSQNTSLPAVGLGGVVLNNAGGTGVFNSDQAKRVLDFFGIDARWRSGPWSLDPTFIYLTGTNDVANNAVGLTGGVVGQDVRSWLVDIRGGYRVGPLNLEGFFLYTPGNNARDNIGQYATGRKLAAQNWLNPPNTGGAYGATWSNFLVGGIDYIRAPYIGTSMYSGTAISLDRYGRVSAAIGPSYALTPALTLNGLVAAHWTDKKVDNHGVFSGAAGWTPETAGGNINGESNYVGTEVALGLTWSFAPGLTFDTSFAHLFAGDALRQCRDPLVGGVCGGGGGAREISDAKDATSLAARVRFQF